MPTRRSHITRQKKTDRRRSKKQKQQQMTQRRIIVSKKMLTKNIPWLLTWKEFPRFAWHCRWEKAALPKYRALRAKLYSWDFPSKTQFVDIIMSHEEAFTA